MKGFALVLGLAVSVFAQQEVVCTDPRVNAVLDFSNTYVVNAVQDIATVVTFPDGYTVTAVVPGSVDYIHCNVVQNAVYVTAAVDENAKTDVVVHVVTPGGLNQKLILKVATGAKLAPVYGIHFAPEDMQGVNQIVAAAKERYELEMAAKLDAVSKNKGGALLSAMVDARPWFMEAQRGDYSCRFKGAEVWVEGLINCQGATYVYLRANTKRDGCDIVQLLSVSQGKSDRPAKLLNVSEDAKNVYYVYEVAMIPIEQGKEKSISLNLEIWSKKQTLKMKIS